MQKFSVKLDKGSEPLPINCMMDGAIACQKYIVANSIREKDWLGGQIYENGKIVAYVPYSCRSIITNSVMFPAHVLDEISRKSKGEMPVEFEALHEAVYRAFMGLYKNDLLALLIAKGTIDPSDPDSWNLEIDRYLLGVTQSLATSLKQTFPNLHLSIDGQELLRQH